MKNLLKKFFSNNKKETKPRDFEWEKFQKMAKKQFKTLKDKGLNIPVVTI